ncbi:hypothetical protein CsSME_00002120 [Camellia sinensis var. sinensis]
MNVYGSLENMQGFGLLFFFQNRNVIKFCGDPLVLMNQHVPTDLAKYSQDTEKFNDFGALGVHAIRLIIIHDEEVLTNNLVSIFLRINVGYSMSNIPALLY